MQLKSIEQFIQDAVRREDVPSMCVSFGTRGNVMARFCEGVTRFDGGVPVNEHTLYDMASLTKVMSTTMVALHALEEGKITLWDTLERFFSSVPEDKREITIKMLMTHTGGFPPHIPLYSLCVSSEDAESVILNTDLVALPGTQVHYSCMGYILLGKIMEAVYKKPLSELAAEKVFLPLRMEETFYCPAFQPNIAATELDEQTGSPWQGIVHDENARFLGGVSGNAGVFSTLVDCEKFAFMLADWKMGFLSPATMRLASVNYTDGQEQNRGLGFHMQGTPYCWYGDLFPASSIGHTGFTGTSLAVCPQTGIYAVILTNRVYPTRENDKIFRVRRALHNMIYAYVSQSIGEG